MGLGWVFLPFLLDPIKSLHFCKKDFFTVDIVHPSQKWKATTKSHSSSHHSQLIPIHTPSLSNPSQTKSTKKHELLNTYFFTFNTDTKILSEKKSHLKIFKQMKNHCFWKQYKNFASDSTFCLRSEHDAAQSSTSICTASDNRDSTPVSSLSRPKKYGFPRSSL